MKVWVVMEWLSYEGEELLGVYASPEAAAREHPDGELSRPCVTCGGDFSVCPCPGTEDDLEDLRRFNKGSGKDIRPMEVVE